MLASTAFGLFPCVLPASTGDRFSLTVYTTIAPEYGLGVGLVWWVIGMIIAAGYFTYVFRSFRGKVDLPPEGEGY
jgi:cytochrome d ubiquinol oxidase subunit II